MILHLFLLLFQLQIKQISTETISGCTINNNNRRIANGKTSVTLSCPNNGYILVKNLTFGVHKTSLLSITPTCSQYSDYMVLDYSCLQGQSLSVCDSRLISTSFSKENRLFLRSPNYPHEYENSLNCSCQISAVKSQMKFLDFYLEERDEINICSRDHLQIHNRSYCGSSIDDNNYRSSSFSLNSSFQLTFKTNDVITRKGFWLSINSEQPIQVSCNSLIEPTSPITTTTTITTPTSTTLQYSIPSSLIPLTESSRFNHNESNSNNNNNNRRHALSYILILTIVFVIILLLLNIVLIILCWRQRRPKGTMNSKINSTNQPFVCSVRSSTSSSIIYGETPVLTSLDIQKQPTLSSRYIFQPNQQHSDTTPSTSTTTATGPYDDLNESMTLQRSFHKERSFDNQFLYLQNRPTFSSPNTAYNRMIHF
ncbi:unnamed protein product, partial [Rotaria magnacalcarata]